MLFVISNSLETEDQFENTDRHADSQEKREIIEIKIPRRQKRSADSSISFPLKAFGRDINLNLQQTNGILFSSKTPVYFLRTGQSQTLMETKYNMFSSNLLSKLYVDEEKQAAFTLTTDPTDGSTKIKYGFIGSENLIIDQLNPNASIDRESDITYNQDHYVATSIANIISHAVADFIGVGVNRRNPAKSTTSIPETIYPEILIMVDYDLYRKFNDHEIIPFLIQFWNGVDLYYHQLQNPRYKLCVAGVAIAQDQHVWKMLSPSSSWGGQSLLHFNSVISQMGPWLRNAGNAIPINSYDTHIIMTPYRDGVEVPSGTVGMAYISSACSNVNGFDLQGGAVYETGNLRQILTAVHELGHM
ncbi:A disintegrin and metalloproteinase with thrombospondin motifs like [Microplitis mediator]|uniref:A disintegrin and metalloproteinase with thrombospondin motifs like n=1 Tax=Microplitis mediator TaxID=375433 RepID=UPI0025521614|nr:A disintegrin and metalloproteinase with thrombospondin motifs like [Microplitis mediator]